eukprot:jgi/Bigna1/69631/fgenesh1_pg.9_\
MPFVIHVAAPSFSFLFLLIFILWSSSPSVPIMADNYAYILVDHRSGQCGIVDPGASTPVALACFQLGLVPHYILLTHCHQDHCGGVEELKRQFPSVEVYCSVHEEVSGVKTRKLVDKSVVKLGSTRIVALETPCHTPGSLVLTISKASSSRHSIDDELKCAEAILTDYGGGRSGAEDVYMYDSCATALYDISTPPPPLDGEYGDGVITALASSPSAWKRVDGGGRSKGREMKETKEIGLRMNLPPTGRQQPQSANKAAGAASSSAGAAGTPLWPLVHPASARSNYSGMAETDRKEGNGVDEGSKKEEDKIADTFKKIRALQQLFDTLIPARHFHLRGRRGGALAVQLQTESMVWADGHIYLTSDLFSSILFVCFTFWSCNKDRGRDQWPHDAGRGVVFPPRE